MDGGIHLPVARIGPNAVTRVAEALGDAAGEDAVLDLFATAGLSYHLVDPPQRMVAEQDVTTLHAAMRIQLGEAGAVLVGAEAGRRTADYLLAHRIPGALQLLLRIAPRRMAARVLLGAIGRHAWTFSGSGRFEADPGRPARVTIAGCPLCRGARTSAPACGYFAATLERLFQRLVYRSTRVRETACQARGDPACVFEIAY